MNIKELKSALSEAKTPTWFENISLNLNFPSIGITPKLEGFTSMYLYIQSQEEGWKTLMDKIPKVLQSSSTFFTTTINHFNNIILYVPNYDENQLNSAWNGVTRAVNSHDSTQIFTYDSAETEFIINIHSEHPEFVNDVFHYLTAQNRNIDPNSRLRFTAYMLAYEFQQKDFTKITKRRQTEKASITRLKNDFNKYLSKSEKQLNDFLNDSKNRNEAFASDIDALRINKAETFDKWYNESHEKHHDFVAETTNHRQELENTYRDLLRLKEPAEYWKTRAVELKKQGWKSLYWLIALVIIGAGLLFSLLLLIPGDTLADIFKSTGSAIKWSVIFITFISFMAYGIGLLSKVSFSAFHLARDAEEREQLTYLYLSLKQDGNVEESDRQLILQSLFSRADTGLLKDDASPTMPGASGFLNKFMSH